MKTFLSVVVFFLLFGCASSSKQSAEKMSQLQLQEKLQRFYTRFTERLVENLTISLSSSTDPKLSEIAYRQYLLYDSEALKIATGPYPEINMLDMLVFVKLSKFVVDDYWIPKVFHQNGSGLAIAFEASEADVQALAGELLSEEQLERVNELVTQWQIKHPHEHRVEKIRMSEFTEYITAREKSGGFSFNQMIVDTQSAVSAVDDMVLVSNRGMFLIQQLPFLVRLHSKILSMEVVNDIADRFGFSSFARGGGRQAQEAPGVLMKLESLIDGAYDTLIYLQSSPKLSQQVRDRLHHELWFLGGFVVLIFFILSCIWWGMAWLVKYRYHG